MRAVFWILLMLPACKKAPVEAVVPAAAIDERDPMDQAAEEAAEAEALAKQQEHAKRQAAALAVREARIEAAERAEVPADVTLRSGVVKLGALGPSQYAVTVGSFLQLGYSEHGSVGKTSRASSYGDFLEKVDATKVYDNPDAVAAGMSGADAASGMWTWQAKKPGTATIRVENSFRGDVTSVRIIRVRIEPAP